MAHTAPESTMALGSMVLYQHLEPSWVPQYGGTIADAAADGEEGMVAIIVLNDLLFIISTPRLEVCPN